MTTNVPLWQPIATAPRDGRVVELLSPSEGVDRGYWYPFDYLNWPADNLWWEPLPGCDYTGDFSTDNGSGDYTHWREINS
jgi:hypothetical protein